MRKTKNKSWYARVENFHGSLLSDLAQVWQCPDHIVWLRSGADQHSMTKKGCTWQTKFFFTSFEKLIG